MLNSIKFTPDNIQSLTKDEIIIVGTNTKGIHGAGAAKLAHEKFGLIWGIGEGISGNTYALPTKDKNIKPRDLKDIKKSIQHLLIFVNYTPEKTFYLTRIGTGLAGFLLSEIANLFVDFLPIPDNLIVPKEFYTYWVEEDLEIYCIHKDERVEKTGMTETVGFVICNDCGKKREWNAY